MASFGRIRNKTIPTHVIEQEKEMNVEVAELVNLKKWGAETVKKTAGIASTVGSSVRDFHVGAFKGIEAGIQTGKRVFEIFWGEVARDLTPDKPRNMNVMSEFHFNMLKRGMTDYEKKYYKFLRASDEQLEGSYEDYVKRSHEELLQAQEDFKNGIKDFIISKQEELKANDDRAIELMEKYGISAQLGYGFGQMLGNYNELGTNVLATYLGAQFGTATGLLGMDDVMNVSENIISNTISESVIADARGEEIDKGNIATRTVTGSLFMKGLSTLIKTTKGGITNRLEVRKLKKIQAVLAEDVIKARQLADALDRGLVTDTKNTIKFTYPTEESKIFTEEVGSDLYKQYTILKATEEFAYGPDGIGIKNQEKLELTKSRKGVEELLRKELKNKFGDDYKFEKYLNDMDNAYKTAKVDPMDAEKSMEIPETKAIKNEDVDMHVKEAQFLEDQDVSMLNNIEAEYAEIKEVLGKTDADVRSWFDTNC